MVNVMMNEVAEVMLTLAECNGRIGQDGNDLCLCKVVDGRLETIATITQTDIEKAVAFRSAVVEAGLAMLGLIGDEDHVVGV